MTKSKEQSIADCYETAWVIYCLARTYRNCKIKGYQEHVKNAVKTLLNIRILIKQLKGLLPFPWHTTNEI